METQDAMLSRRLGTTIAPRTYEDHLHESSDYAAVLDNRYSKAQANRRSANSSNVSSNSNNSNGGNNSGRRSGGRGRGRGDSGGRGNGGRGRGRGNGGRGNGGRGNTNSYINKTTWYDMTWDERQAIIEARKRARSANNTNVMGNQDAESTIAGPPTTVNVDNGTTGNNNNRQANTTNQGSQPGTMIRNMMSSASACSAMRLLAHVKTK